MCILQLMLLLFVSAACCSITFLCLSVSPEGKYSYASDIWSAGVSLWNLATGQLPYHGDAQNLGYFGIVKAIRDEPVPTLPELSPATNTPFSKDMHDFLRLCLVKDPASRATAAQLLEHPWLTGAEQSWQDAVAAAHEVGKEVHPLCKLSAADVSDLDAILHELLRSTAYSAAVTAKPSSSSSSAGVSDPRKSLMHQARMARLSESLNNPKLSASVIAQRFDKIFDAERARAQAAQAS
jgi:serine/threonine protein kinase